MGGEIPGLRAVAKTMSDTRENRLLIVGATGSVIAAICCFTPILVVLLAAVGLSAVVGWLDYVLFPALAMFLAITGYAIWQKVK